METAGGIAAVGHLAEILAVPVVERTENPAFRVVAQRRRSVAIECGGSVEFLVVEIGEHVLAFAVDVLIGAVVAFMSGQQGDVVVAKLLGVLEQLLKVERIFRVVVLVDVAVGEVGVAVAIEGVIGVGAAVVAGVDTSVERE